MLYIALSVTFVDMNVAIVQHDCMHHADTIGVDTLLIHRHDAQMQHWWVTPQYCICYSLWQTSIKPWGIMPSLKGEFIDIGSMECVWVWVLSLFIFILANNPLHVKSLDSSQMVSDITQFPWHIDSHIKHFSHFGQLEPSPSSFGTVLSHIEICLAKL